MKLKELINAIGHYEKITIVTIGEYIPFEGHKYNFDITLKKELEGKRKPKLINCLDKNVTYIYMNGSFIAIEIAAFIGDIIPGYQEPDSNCRP